VDIENNSFLVTGGASGLGLATAQLLASAGGHVTIADLPASSGKDVAAGIGASFVPMDVSDAEQVEAAVEAAARDGALRGVIHCAGRGGPLRLVERDGSPGSLERWLDIIAVNLTGSFNVLRFAAAKMAASEEVDGERGVIVMTASVAAFEGQIGQIPYAASKAGIHGMTIVAARDLATKRIRVNTIAPGLFETPILSGLSDAVRDSLERSIPNPSRFGRPEEFAELATLIVRNRMLNGETIRLDGAIRMSPR